jgi:hypothetical protein
MSIDDMSMIDMLGQDVRSVKGRGLQLAGAGELLYDEAVESP